MVFFRKVIIFYFYQINFERNIYSHHMMELGGTFLYCAPDNARSGMELFVGALEEVNLKCVSQIPCPEE